MLKNCPTCGAQISARLVDEILNPMREESCPKEIIRRQTRKEFVSSSPERKMPSLTTLMLGAFVGEEKN